MKKKIYSRPFIASQDIALQSAIMSGFDNNDPNNDNPITAPARKLYV